ncbi:MAG: 2-hydroxyacid dehydrogenase [Gammaproteobacteria bacterium]|nr:2-hydroxyacid dehydrogenase [Gammaproteobacteria bacterium]MDH3370034.1 2-hydroxyacid dehydrogenase [Gammaproteobacteria bacterium]MDH3407514.1 2-hydroxyacid dehydrogenase [Gammaproteobacteria bacterium]MDH5487449.1 2-hydroxyacid dehydrogenase [Gammaproteobacteria bacterium]
MKFNKIVMLCYSQSNFREQAGQRLRRLSEEIKALPEDSPEIPNHIADADCLLVETGISVDQTLISAAPRLKYIGVFGSGYGRVDVPYAASRGITVCNTPGYSTEGVAEFVFGVILEHIREIERAKAYAREGHYSGFGFRGEELRDKKFGIIGLGRIGRRIADIAHKGFGADVSYWSRNRKIDTEKTGVRYADINAVLRHSDFLSINLAHVPATEKFINADRIALIKPGAVVVHLAPVEVIDLDGLETRLKRADMTYILDHSDELSPDQAKRLARYRHCVMYPAIACITQEARHAKLAMFLEDIQSYLEGERPRYAI